MVEKYRVLRQDDGTGAGRNSYRITVRQLESMIRLSEAIARANCTSEVSTFDRCIWKEQTHLQITPAFVREAYSLLRQSIIHVEQDDIDFDEEDKEIAPENIQPKMSEDDSQDVPMSGGDTEMTEQTYVEQSGTTDGSTSTQAQGLVAPKTPQNDGPTSSKRRMVITHDKYMTLQSLIVLHLAAIERETGKGIDRDELIDWYLEMKEEEIQDVDELEYEKELVTKVLRKLVKVRVP